MSYHNIDLEKSVLASLMSIENSLDHVSSIIDTDDFVADRHKSLYRGIKELHAEGLPYDNVMLHDWIAANKLVEATGGDGYIADILSESPSTLFNLAAYAGRIKELSQYRDIDGLLVQMRENLKHNEASLEVKVNDSIEQLIRVIDTSKVSGGAKTVGSMMDRFFEDLVAASSGEVTPFKPTGFEEIDARVPIQNGDLVIIGARPSMGKQQKYSAKVRTTSGWTTMGELAVGDKLASIDGLPSVVTGIFEQGVQQSYKLTFSDGRSTEAGLEHLWEIMYRHWKQPRIVNTAKLIDMLTKARYKNRVWIEPYAIESENDTNLLIPPYLMGALLGDGGFTGQEISFSNGDLHIVDKVMNNLPKINRLRAKSCNDYVISGGIDGVKGSLQFYGLLGRYSTNKFIPRDYLDAPLSDRLELIRGLIDTDGWVEKHGSMLYSTSSKQLSDDFAELIRSVGGTCSTKTKIKPKYTYKGDVLEGCDSYISTIGHIDLDSLVSLPRKRDRLQNRVSSRVNRLTLTSVELAGVEKQRCISVSHDSHLYITDDYIVTHNTTYGQTMVQNMVENDMYTDESGNYKRRSGVFFSIEMTDASVVQRFMASKAGVKLQRIRSGAGLDVDDWSGLNKTVENYRDEYPMFIESQTGMSIAQMRTTLNKIRNQHGEIGVIMVDYIQIMGEAKGKDAGQKANAIGEIAKSLKAFGKEFNCPVIALSQLNRSLESRPDKRPIMSDLKESGAIEENADVIMFLYRDEVYNEGTEAKGIAEVGIAKNRQGQVGKVLLSFEGQYSRFSNLMPTYQGDVIPPYGEQP